MTSIRRFLLWLRGFIHAKETPIPQPIEAEPKTEPPILQPKGDYSRDITYCHPYLRERWPKLLAMFRERTNDDLILTCTWRSVKEQQRLYAQGRTEFGQIITNCDGVKTKSNHNVFPARAFDLAVDIEESPDKEVINWQAYRYTPLGAICKELGLVWGGSWVKFKDFPHVEMPSDVA